MTYFYGHLFTIAPGIRGLFPASMHAQRQRLYRALRQIADSSADSGNAARDGTVKDDTTKDGTAKDDTAQGGAVEGGATKARAPGPPSPPARGATGRGRPALAGMSFPGGAGRR